MTLLVKALPSSGVVTTDIGYIAEQAFADRSKARDGFSIPFSRKTIGVTFFDAVPRPPRADHDFVCRRVVLSDGTVLEDVAVELKASKHGSVVLSPPERTFGINRGYGKGYFLVVARHNPTKPEKGFNWLVATSEQFYRMEVEKVYRARVHLPLP